MSMDAYVFLFSLLIFFSLSDVTVDDEA